MTNQTLVIGGTGFLGQKVSELGAFLSITSKTTQKELRLIKDRGKIERVVICAPSSKRYLANKAPLSDMKSIIDVCDKVNYLDPEKILFCSTVDANDTFFDPKTSPLDTSLDINFYGIHRNLLENYLRSEFEEVTVIRLGNLFGYNLRKNIIYDLLNATEPFQTPNNLQQWVNADWLAEMIVNSPELFIDGMTLVSEPIQVSEISEIICRNHSEMKYTEAIRAYDIKSDYAFKKNSFCTEPNGYTFQKETILKLMKRVYG
ncbi:hypothetical protein N9755_01360 [bacterium]|nr:hypothetical protein [bacterium]